MRNFYRRKGILSDIMGSTMEQNAVKSDFKRIHKLKFHQKVNRYYTCKRREVQVNQGGHLTKLHEAVHELNPS